MADISGLMRSQFESKLQRRSMQDERLSIAAHVLISCALECCVAPCPQPRSREQIVCLRKKSRGASKPPQHRDRGWGCSSLRLFSQTSTLAIYRLLGLFGDDVQCSWAGVFWLPVVPTELHCGHMSPSNRRRGSHNCLQHAVRHTMNQQKAPPAICFGVSGFVTALVPYMLTSSLRTAEASL